MRGIRSHAFAAVRTFTPDRDVVYGLTKRDTRFIVMQSATETYSVPVSHLGIQSAEALRTPLHKHIQSHTEAVLDLSQVERYDAIGLQLLYSCQKTAQQAGGQLKIVHAAPALAELMESLGLQRETLSALAAE